MNQKGILFNTVFPDCDKPTNNEIDFYMNHNVPEYRDNKKTGAD